MLERIISGGQTGVDRAALDAAIAAGLAVGGWCPLGRKAEDGVIPPHYPLVETPTGDYAERTEFNVRDSNGTLILYRGEMSGGTLTTAHLARDKYARPLCEIRLDETPDSGSAWGWIMSNRIHVLNVAGPRESKEPGIHEAARTWLMKLFDLDTLSGLKR